MLQSLDRLTDISGELNAIRGSTAKLLRSDPAGELAPILVKVLQEVSKTSNVLEGLLIKFLSLDLSTEAGRSAAQAELQFLQGSGPMELVGQMRARCSKIYQLFDARLRPWFATGGLDTQELNRLTRVFAELGGADDDVIKPAVAELVGWLQDRVDAVSQQLQAGRYPQAEALLAAARREVLSSRRAMGRLQSDLIDLEEQFTG